MLEEMIDACLISPFTAMMAGPTGCGKTTLLTRLIERSNLACTKLPVEVIYCYGANQDRFAEMPDANFHEGMVDVDNILNDSQHKWLILDDLMAEVGGTPELNALFTKHSHHRLITAFSGSKCVSEGSHTV